MLWTQASTPQGQQETCPVPVEQPGQKYHVSLVLFCHGYNFTFLFYTK